MNRIKITCLEGDRKRLLNIIEGSYMCPFNFEECSKGTMECDKCIKKNIEFELRSEV